MEYFFRFLLFENYGTFVLFGSKPLCEMCLRDTESTETDPAFQEWFDSIAADKQAELKARMKHKIQPELKLKRNPYRGWLAWEKVSKTFDMKRYILRIVPLRCPGSYEVMLVNIQQTALVLAENYTIFKNASGMEFDPLGVVFELQNPDSIFWKNVFSRPNHLAKGLLFGFGLRNSIFGDWFLTYSNKNLSGPESVIMDYLRSAPFILSKEPTQSDVASPSNFTIPTFGAVEGDTVAKKYTNEKKIIQKIYSGQDLVEVTLRRLAGVQ